MSNPPRPTPDPDTTSIGAAAKYAGLGFQLVASILLFLYAGRWVDRRIGTEPLFLLLGVFTGLAASIYSMYRSLMADQRREAERRGGGTR
jgi:ATP synthase protein I